MGRSRNSPPPGSCGTRTRGGGGDDELSQPIPAATPKAAEAPIIPAATVRSSPRTRTSWKGLKASNSVSGRDTRIPYLGPRRGRAGRNCKRLDTADDKRMDGLRHTPRRQPLRLTCASRAGAGGSCDPPIADAVRGTVVNVFLRVLSSWLERRRPRRAVKRSPRVPVGRLPVDCPMDRRGLSSSLRARG